MINQEIFQGIKFALIKKQSLKSAMESFYNAGYKKEDIEDAARAVQMEEFEQKMNAPLDAQKGQPQKVEKAVGKPSPIQKFPSKKEVVLPSLNQKKTPEKYKETTLIKKPLEKKKNIQKVSQYEQPKDKPKKDVLAIILIFILLLLLGVLAAVFLFKTELLEFFNKFL